MATRTQIGAWYQETTGLTWNEYDDGTIETYKFSLMHGRKVPFRAKVGEIHGLIAIPFGDDDF